MRRLAGAIQFLTLIPAGPGAGIGESAVFFPLVGAIVGALASGVYLLLDRIFPIAISSLGALLYLVLITGGLHEDALADAADALRSGRSPEKILAIMKDSRIGSYGGVALLFSILIRWQALAALGARSTVALVISETLPRAAFVLLSRAANPAGTGLGSAMSAGLTRNATLLAAAQTIAIAVALAPRLAPALLLGTAAVVWLARLYFHRRIGGVTGDCLGATGQIVECFCLLAFVAVRGSR